MKKFIYIILLLFISTNIAAAQKFDVIDGDTINFVDDNNLKQGFWKIFGKMKRLPDYEPNQIVEEGAYKNSRKNGLWKRFFPNGNVKSEISYVNSRPKGFYKTFYEDGQVEEEGNWKSNRQTGDFKRYHTNGNIAQKFSFDESGKRNGIQEYYYEDGTPMIVADIKAGKEQTVTEYFPDGSLKSEKIFNDGVIDAEKTKTFEPKTPIVEKEVDEGVEVVVTVDPTVEGTNEDMAKPSSSSSSAPKNTFNGEGTHKLYNKNKQISKDGFFKRFRLIDGKHYIYDENGILINIKQFKKGRYIGDVPLPKD